LIRPLTGKHPRHGVIALFELSGHHDVSVPTLQREALRRFDDLNESSSATKHRRTSRCGSGHRAPGNDVAARDQGFAEAQFLVW
jgi:hypothetical protein